MSKPWKPLLMHSSNAWDVWGSCNRWGLFLTGNRHQGEVVESSLLFMFCCVIMWSVSCLNSFGEKRMLSLSQEFLLLFWQRCIANSVSVKYKFITTLFIFLKIYTSKVYKVHSLFLLESRASPYLRTGSFLIWWREGTCTTLAFLL